MQAIHMYGLTVPPDGIPIKGHAGVNATFRITMAAIDPTEEPVTNGESHPRATLKLIRTKFPPDEDDDDDDYDSDDIEALERRIAMAEEDDDSEDEEDDEDDEMVNGGPSDPERAKKLLKEALAKNLDDDEDEDDGVEPKTLGAGVNGIFKGKGKAVEMDDDDDGIQEFVVCTLDSKHHYQQPIDITIQGNEDCFFRVIGGHTVHLTGNYILDDLEDSDEEDDEEDSEEEEEYDTLDNMLLNAESDLDENESEEDVLDSLALPRIMELDNDDEVPQLVKGPQKSTKKRPADEDAAEAGASAKAEDGKANRSKKIKTNAGDAVAAGKNQPAKTEEAEKKEAGKDQAKSKKEQAKINKKEAKKNEQNQTNGKKVQFAEKLEQGPTVPKGAAAAKGPRNVNGVMVDDKKTGTGPAAKKGDKVGMRYIGKLKDGKVFDSNKKGSPFKFKIGGGEVIKGWDIGVQGMTVGGERRIVIPARLAYGGKAMPGIPANSDLTFDLKMISIN